MTLHPFGKTFPVISSDVFIAPGAHVIGEVEIGEGSSVWYNCVLRGDTNFIRVGKRTNIQDLSVVHVAADILPAIIGDDVTVGHRAVIHACTIGNRCLIGMGAVVMDRCVIGDDCIIAAGSLLPEGIEVPPGSVVMGSPGKVRRAIHDAEREWIEKSAQNYYQLAKTYRGL